MIKVVGVLIIDKDYMGLGPHILLLLKQQGPYQGQWITPGGKYEEDENWKDCAIRESKEETGWEVDPEYLLGDIPVPTTHPENKVGFDFRMEYIYAHPVKKVAELSQEEKDKNGEGRWFPLNNLPSPLIYGTTEALKMLEQYLKLSPMERTTSSLLQTYQIVTDNLRQQIALHKGTSESKDEIIIKQEELITLLRKRLTEVMGYLEKTADGELVVECKKLYCPKCSGEVEQEITICYCFNCPNPDAENSIPLPLSFSACLAQPFKEEKSAHEKSPAG
jgi:8-oxo-dGTP diphosphatase